MTSYYVVFWNLCCCIFGRMELLARPLIFRTFNGCVRLAGVSRHVRLVIVHIMIKMYALASPGMWH